MLTDDDLTRDLRAAFHDAADDLAYDGAVPTVRRTPAWASYGWLALPAAAAVAAGVVVAGGTPTDVTAPPSAAPTPGSPSADPTTPAPGPAMVTDEIEVAGFSFAYEHAAGEGPLTVALTRPDSLPDDAREVTTPEMDPARAWVGTDPETGVPVLYLKAPTRNDGKLFGLSSRQLDTDGLIDLLKYGWRD